MIVKHEEIKFKVPLIRFVEDPKRDVAAVPLGPPEDNFQLFDRPRAAIQKALQPLLQERQKKIVP
jgi:hypothetical protein